MARGENRNQIIGIDCVEYRVYSILLSIYNRSQQSKYESTHNLFTGYLYVHQYTYMIIIWFPSPSHSIISRNKCSRNECMVGKLEFSFSGLASCKIVNYVIEIYALQYLRLNTHTVIASDVSLIEGLLRLD